MKTWIAVAVTIGVIGLGLSAARAAVPPKTEQLKNFDKRNEASQAMTKSSQMSTPGSPRAAAAAALKTRVPRARISEDKIVGGPRHIAASRGFLTEAGGKGGAVSEAALAAVPAGDPHRVIKAFLNEHSALMGHDAGALVSADVQRDYVTKHNGLRTVVWQQMLDGVPVFDGLLIGHVTRNEELVSISDCFVPDAARAANAGTPKRNALLNQPAISAAKAVELAAANLGAEVKEGTVSVAKAAQGVEKKQSLKSAGLRRTAELQLVWLPMSQDSMRLCWQVMLSAGLSHEFFMVLVDAETGEALVRRSLTMYAAPITFNVFTGDSPSPLTPGWDYPSSEQPGLVERVPVTYPDGAFDTNASPAGWVNDLNPRTTGNNVVAFLDRDYNYAPDKSLPVATGGVFNYPMDLESDEPLDYADASTVQLFWRANWYHDRLYQLGFTEAAGNYQVDNYGRGGIGGDPIRCHVQNGADIGEPYLNNSWFEVNPEGSPGDCCMFVFTGPTPDRDGSMDQEVVIHELTHGTSFRLVGGGMALFALQSGGLGEGWSDFYGLAMLSEASDDVNGNYPVGGYATYLFGGMSFEENYYFGIRRYPYSTDMTKNPLTFKDIDPTQCDQHYEVPFNDSICSRSYPSEVHYTGEVWCAALWEMRANLVDKLGWTIGNEMALQLATDGMKLTPPNPTFLEARDAILMADEINNDGDNANEIWMAFAKRGMGYGATCPTSDTTTGVGESFDGPLPDGVLEVNIRPEPWSALYAGDTITHSLRVTDAIAITNATVAARIIGSTNLVYLNDGTGADKRPNDSVYTTVFTVPTNVNTLTIELVVSVPGYYDVTNLAQYFVVAVAPNDNFANATKALARGTNYVTSNVRATRESNEPYHANTGSPASLWWNYKSDVATNVLVDTAGSTFVSVVAVYTNNTLAALSPVASAIGSASRKGAFLNFNARAGVTYRIAVAGSDYENVGTVMLKIQPGSLADTNAPLVAVTSPVSGAVVATNRLFLTGTAVDQGNSPSGIKSIAFVVNSASGYTTTIVRPWACSFDGVVSSNWTGVVGLRDGLNTVRVYVSDFAGNTGTASVQVNYRPLDPPNDFFVNAAILTNTAGTNSANTLGATKETGEPNHAGTTGGRSAWWTFTPAADGALTLSTINSSFDTVLAIYTGASVGSLAEVASNDDAYDGAPGGFSQITQAVRSGQTYRIAVDGYDGLAGAVILTHSFVPTQIFHVTASSTAGGTATPASTDVQSNGVVVLSAVPDVNYQFDMWDGSLVSLGNPLSATVTKNLSFTARFRPVAYTDGFESGNLTYIGWTSGGNKPWVIQTNIVSVGRYAAKSGVIANSQSSSLILAASFRAGNGSFGYRVSSESGYDNLRFLVDGVVMQQWSGEVGWSGFTFPLTAGAHTLEWRYIKDASGSAGLDAAFIDNVNLPLVVGTNAWSSAHLNLQRQSGGSYFVTLSGQTNQQYILQGSTNLVNWQGISTNTATDGFLRIPDPASTTNLIQYYRAVVAP